MKLLKIFINNLLIIFILIFSQNLFAVIVNKKCGKYIFGINVFINTKEYLIQHILFYKERNKKMIFYKSEPGLILNGLCIQNKEGKYLMLFKELCGGNGCPENVYGIFDPLAKKLLLDPKDWLKGNSKEVRKILGASLFEDMDADYFCCSTERKKLRDRQLQM